MVPDPEPLKPVQRFAFGDNWYDFLSTVDEARIRAAEMSLQQSLAVTDLKNRRFLDIGSGSGLFSLAAWRMGAIVTSIDYDPMSVASTVELRQRFATDARWTVERGDVLDAEYMRRLGQFDAVYAWGVLHHTGNMWKAMENVVPTVSPSGRLVIALYNDQGWVSRFWGRVKQRYVAAPRAVQVAMVLVIASVFEAEYAAVRLASGRSPLPFRDWQEKKAERGMSAWHDWVDWVGGYPYQVARPDDVFRFFRDRGFVLCDMKTGRGYGCNEYVFQRLS